MNSASLIIVSNKDITDIANNAHNDSLVKTLRKAGYEIVHTAVVPNDLKAIEDELIRTSDNRKTALGVILRDTAAMDDDQTWLAMQNVCTKILDDVFEDSSADNSQPSEGLHGGALLESLMHACGFSSKNFERASENAQEKNRTLLNSGIVLDDLLKPGAYLEMRRRAMLRRTRSGMRGTTLFLATPWKMKPIKMVQPSELALVYDFATNYA